MTENFAKTRSQSESAPSAAGVANQIAAGRSQAVSVGIDVGGTKIAAGAVEFPDGKVWARLVVPTLPARGGEAVFSDVLKLVQDLKMEMQARSVAIQSIGLGVCELVDLHGSIVSANCLSWLELPVAKRLSSVAPTVIDADVRLAARAEAQFGAGRPFRIFLYVTVGTGISCCLMIDGTPYAGARGATGTMASSPLPITSTATPGCALTLEQFASGPALGNRFADGSGPAPSGREVLAAAMAGNGRAREIIQSAATALGAVIGGLISVLDPEAIVLGGGLGLSEGLYWDTVLVNIRRHIWCDGHREIPILRAALGTDAGVIGAAAAAWTRLTSVK